MDNKVFILLILLALYFLCYKKEGFSYTSGVLEGYNNMVLTDTNGNLGSIQFPRGMIVIWNGLTTSVPEGWALCDGRTVNGVQTPDLRGKFVLGVNPDSQNATYRTIRGGGGSETNTLTVSQLPAHNHEVLITRDSQGAHNWRSEDFNIMSSNRDGGYNMGETQNAPFIKPTGGGQPVNNMPPYLVLAYIMKL
jgi:microcystin-dependent protein